MLITEPSYSVMEAFGRMGQIQEDFVTMYTADKIQKMGSFINSAGWTPRQFIKIHFLANPKVSLGYAVL